MCDNKLVSVISNNPAWFSKLMSKYAEYCEQWCWFDESTEIDFIKEDVCETRLFGNINYLVCVLKNGWYMRIYNSRAYMGYSCKECDKDVEVWVSYREWNEKMCINGNVYDDEEDRGIELCKKCCKERKMLLLSEYCNKKNMFDVGGLIGEFAGIV